MSKFTSIVDEAMTKQQMQAAGQASSIDSAKRAELRKKKNPLAGPTGPEKALLKAKDKADKKVRQMFQKAANASHKPKGKVVEAEGDEVAPAPAPDAAAPAPDVAGGVAPEPLTTEGEVFLVNLAKDCLNTDLSSIDLDKLGIDRSLITQDAQPENSKEIEKVLRRIVGEGGLGENFDSKIDALIEDLKKNDRVVVLVPGSFKPPHKGHYEMVRQYSETYSQGHVHVLISAPSANSERRTKDGKLITPAAAKQIFELYVQPLNNVTISVSEFPSPVTAAFESLKTLDPGTTVILGASKKDNDWKRWTSAQAWAEKEGLELDIVNPEETAVDVVSNNIGRPYSASNIRDNFDNFDQIKTDIPEHVSPEEIKVIFDSL